MMNPIGTVQTARKKAAPPADDYNDYVHDLRNSEYPQLRNHAGTTLYANSLIDVVALDLKTNLFGNPHSDSPSSHLSSVRIDGVRAKFLHYLNADPEHFDIIFTGNATAAIKLVVNGFREHDFRYYYHKDAHTSLVGIRELASAGSRCFSDEEVEEWLENGDATNENSICLFAWPAQSNMTGYRPPLSWAGRLRMSENGSHRKVYSLLDASSYLTTGLLDLSNPSTAPDFVSLSFYKIFGFPDIGALIVRKDAGSVLTSRKYFAGGTVDMVIGIGDQWHAMRTESLHDILEDGTLPFHSILAIEHALNVQKRLFGNASHISRRVSGLSASLYQSLSRWRHWNDVPVVEVYKEACAVYGDATTQGPILAFNIRRADETWAHKSHFEILAIACNIQMRSGGVCNPGGIATMLGLEQWKMRRNYCEGMRCGDDLDVIGGQPTGILRVSLGAMSTQHDLDVFTLFVEHFFVETVPRAVSAAGRADSRAEIQPIAGCPPISLPQVGGQSQRASETLSLFHHEWCIVDSDTLRPIDPSEKLKRTLQTFLLPEDGSLIFKTVEDNYFATETLVSSESANVNHGLLTPCLSTTSISPNPSVTINLWDPPPESPSNISGCDGRVADPYSEPEIARFFSHLAGRPCTLGRYRAIRSRHISASCEIAGCHIELANKEELRYHYAQHAKAFLDPGLETKDTSSPTVTEEPAVNDAAKSSWMNWPTAFRRRARGRR